MLDEQDTPTSPVHAFDVYDAVDFSGSLLVESSEETEDRVDVAAEDDTSTEEFLARGTSIENSRFSSEHDDSDQLTIALVDSVREELDKTGRGSSDSELLLSPMQVRLKCLRPADGIPSTPLTALGLSFEWQRHSEHLVISEIIPGGPADLSGQLVVGDMILAINDKEVRGMDLISAFELVENVSKEITLLVLHNRSSPSPSGNRSTTLLPSPQDKMEALIDDIERQLAKEKVLRARRERKLRMASSDKLRLQGPGDGREPWHQDKSPWEVANIFDSITEMIEHQRRRVELLLNGLDLDVAGMDYEAETAAELDANEDEAVEEEGPRTRYNPLASPSSSCLKKVHRATRSASPPPNDRPTTSSDSATRKRNLLGAAMAAVREVLEPGKRSPYSPQHVATADGPRVVGPKGLMPPSEHPFVQEQLLTMRVIKYRPQLTEKPPEVVKAAVLAIELGNDIDEEQDKRKGEELLPCDYQDDSTDESRPAASKATKLRWSDDVAQEDGHSARRYREYSIRKKLEIIAAAQEEAQKKAELLKQLEKQQQPSLPARVAPLPSRQEQGPQETSPQQKLIGPAILLQQSVANPTIATYDVGSPNLTGPERGPSKQPAALLVHHPSPAHKPPSPSQMLLTPRQMTGVPNLLLSHRPVPGGAAALALNFSPRLHRSQQREDNTYVSMTEQRASRESQASSSSFTGRPGSKTPRAGSGPGGHSSSHGAAGPGDRN